MFRGLSWKLTSWTDYIFVWSFFALVLCLGWAACVLFLAWERKITTNGLDSALRYLVVRLPPRPMRVILLSFQ